jgi:hypothetical protein
MMKPTKVEMTATTAADSSSGRKMSPPNQLR